jgi:hypothetical protein
MPTNPIKKSTLCKATYHTKAKPISESNTSQLSRLSSINFWRDLFKFDKLKVATLAATPVISTLDCAATYPAVASIGLMQSMRIKFLPAFRIQLTQPNGLFHGLAQFYVAKNKSRATGCLLGSSLVGDKPTHLNIGIAAIISGLSETFFTNKDITGSRLLVTENKTYINRDILSKCSRAVFPLHAIKNIATIYTALSIFNLTPKKYTQPSPFSENTTRGIFTGIGIMALQLCGAAQLDTAMTLTMKNKHNHPNSKIETREVFKKVMQQSFLSNFRIATARAGVFGISYSITFIIIGKIKDTLPYLIYQPEDKKDSTPKPHS